MTTRHGRVALVDAVTDAVARACADGERLSVALVADPPRAAVTLADDVERIVAAPAYVVGPHAVVFVLEGGRAEALGAIARLEVACGATGRAVELEPGEGAVELLARLLSPRVPG